jgi:DNA-binding LacI/PurR family transcriptional regulator
MNRSVKQHHVAKAVGLSPAAVSRALSGDPSISESTRRRVRETCRKLGYRRSRKGAATQIALVAFQHHNPQFASLDSLPSLALARTAASRSLSIAVHMVQRPDDRTTLATLLDLSDHCDGLVLYGYVTAAVLKGLSAQRVRYVVLGPPEGGIPNLPAGTVAVTTDMVEAGRVATERLIALGHERIAFLCPERPAGMYYDLWLTGYQMAHLRTGRAVEASLVYVGSERQPDRADGSTAAPTVEWMRRLDRPPTAWVVPGVLDFLGLLILGPKAGLSLRPDTVTLGGRQTELVAPLLDGWPMVAEDIDAMIDAACSVLRLMIDGQSPPAGEIKVPFSLHSFEDVSR